MWSLFTLAECNSRHSDLIFNIVVPAIKVADESVGVELTIDVSWSWFVPYPSASAVSL